MRMRGMGKMRGIGRKMRFQAGGPAGFNFGALPPGAAAPATSLPPAVGGAGIGGAGIGGAGIGGVGAGPAGGTPGLSVATGNPFYQQDFSKLAFGNQADLAKYWAGVQAGGPVGNLPSTPVYQNGQITGYQSPYGINPGVNTQNPNYGGAWAATQGMSPQQLLQTPLGQALHAATGFTGQGVRQSNFLGPGSTPPTNPALYQTALNNLQNPTYAGLLSQHGFNVPQLLSQQQAASVNANRTAPPVTPGLPPGTARPPVAARSLTGIPGAPAGQALWGPAQVLAGGGGAMVQRPGAPLALPPGAALMRRGGAVDEDGDTPQKKGRPDRQWGAREEDDEVVTKKARGGSILRRRPPAAKAKVAKIPAADQPVSTPNPDDYSDSGTPYPGMAEGGKWIQGAIKHPGALHKQLGVPAGQKIPAKKLAAAAEKGGTLGRRARLAQTLKKMHKAKGGACEMGKAKGGKAEAYRVGGKAEEKAEEKGYRFGGKKPIRKAIGGVGKLRKGYPMTLPAPKRMAAGGKVRGGGIAQRGLRFEGIY